MKIKYRLICSFCILWLNLPLLCFGGNVNRAIQYYQQAEKLSQQGRYLDAAKMFEKSGDLGLENVESSHPGELFSMFFEFFANTDIDVAYNQAGDHFRLAGVHSKAIENYQDVLENVKKLGPEAELAVALYYKKMGMVSYLWEEYAKALDYYRQSLDILKSHEIDNWVAILLNNIGSIHFSQGQYDMALDYYQNALALDLPMNDQVAIATGLNNIGWVYYTLGQYDKALNSFEQSLKKTRVMDKAATDNKRKDYFTFEEICTVTVDNDMVLQYDHRILLSNRSFFTVAGGAVQLHNMATVYLAMGNYDKAIDCLQMIPGVFFNRKKGITYYRDVVANGYDWFKDDLEKIEAQ